MKHIMKLNNEPYNLIESGIKTIELRLYDEKRGLISVGDEIEFINSSNSDLSLSCRVIALHKFSSFEELYKHLPLLKCGYTAENISTASYRDMELYYAKEEQISFGVVGIEIQLK